MDKLDELSLVGVNLAELTRATKELRQTRDIKSDSHIPPDPQPAHRVCFAEKVESPCQISTTLFWVK